MTMGETSKKCEFYGHMVFDFARSNCQLTIVEGWLSVGIFLFVWVDVQVLGRVFWGAGLA